MTSNTLTKTETLLQKAQIELTKIIKPSEVPQYNHTIIKNISAILADEGKTITVKPSDMPQYDFSTANNSHNMLADTQRLKIYINSLHCPTTSKDILDKYKITTVQSTAQTNNGGNK